MKSALYRLAFLLIGFICFFAFGLFSTDPSLAMHSKFAYGDIFVSISNGQVQWRHPDGTLNRTLTTAAGGFTTGMAFDAAGNLYVTNFSGQTVSKFDPSGNLLGTFGGGYNSHPESIVFDADGNAYVGQADGTEDVLKFDSAGDHVATFNVARERRGSDWVDLADDQCTMYYTSEGSYVKRYNVCTNTQLSNFNNNPLPNSVSYALRVISTGGVMVANTTVIARLDTSGNLIQTYDAPGQNCWFALNLDPDAKSFWSADFCTSNVYKFDLTTGNILLTFNTGTASRTVWGLTVKGEITAAQPCTLPAFGGERGNPIQQLTDELRTVPYGGMEINIPGQGIKFLPYNYGKTMIASEGCYLISGVMVINYYAALQGNPFRTDPIQLNNWMAHNLTNNNSGYKSGLPLDNTGQWNPQSPTHVAGAGVDPNTLIQYAKTKSININLDGPVRTSGRNNMNDELLDTALCKLNPSIVSVKNNGHFVAITGKTKVHDTNTWRLHDPIASTPTNLFDVYQNQYGNRLVIFKDVDLNTPRSRLLLSLYSQAEMIVTDSQGRRTGFDPRTGTLFEEIPFSSYGKEFLASDDGPIHVIEYEILDIETPLSGEYVVEIIGTGNGTIGLDFVPVDVNGDGLRTTIADTVANGIVNTYQLTYSAVPGQPTQFIRSVDIDIKPGSTSNPINLKSRGVIPVAILTTPSFDATTVDPLSVEFGPNRAVKTHNRGHKEDVDNDGDIDLVLHFRTQEVNIECSGISSIVLSGKTFDGMIVSGSDSIIATGCKK